MTGALSETFADGQIVAGRYRILDLIGRGGMGVVYKVEQIFLNKEFALKTIENEDVTDVAIRRFQHEGRAASLLDHPNLIKVHDFGLLENDTPFFVMDFLNGPTLSELIKKRSSLPVSEAVPLFIKLCSALKHAHEQQIVHRDIKPGNIMFAEESGLESEVKIVDFGIAKMVQEADVQAMTRTGEVFGSPLYMSPEQCAAAPVDHRADIYALGCVFFETLTGTPPFIGHSALSTMMKHQGELAPTLKEASLGAEFPEQLERIIARMLAKDPRDRYQDLGAVAHELSQLGGGEGTIQSEVEASSQRREDKSPSMVQMSAAKLIVCAGTTAVLSMGAGALLAVELPTPKVNRPPTNWPGASTYNNQFSYPRADYGVNERGAKVHSFVFDKKMPGLLQDLHTGKIYKASGSVSEIPADHAVALIIKSDDPFGQHPQLLMGIGKKHVNVLAIEGNGKVISAPEIGHLQFIYHIEFKDLRVNDTLIDKLDQLPMLVHLTLDNCKGMTPQRLSNLKRLKNLEALQIDGWSHPTKVLQALQGSSSLRTMFLQHCDLNAKDVALLTGLPRLEYLKVSHNAGIGNVPTIETLASIKSLRHLRLDVPSYSQTCLNALSKLKQLVTLGILSEPEWSAEQIASLKKVLPPQCKVEQLEFNSAAHELKIHKDDVSDLANSFDKWTAPDVEPRLRAPQRRSGI